MNLIEIHLGKLIVLTTLFCGILGSNIPLIAQPNYKVKSSDISFQIKNAGLTVDGSFDGLSANIVFDEKNLAGSFIQASIDANTIQTGITMRDNHLRKDEYFGVKKYPKISMQSTSIEKEGKGFKGNFKLTMKGVTRQISIPFLFDGQTFSGNFNLKRTDFGIGSPNWVTSSEVSIKVSLIVE